MKQTMTVMTMVIALVLSTMAMAVADGSPTITSPTEGEHVLSQLVHLSGINVDDDARWAVRASSQEDDPTCIDQTDVAGNVRGNSDVAEIEDGDFSFTIDRQATQLADGPYCLSINQGDAGDGSLERDRVFFFLASPESKDACKGGGWETNFPEGTYRNQGQCVSFYASDGRSAR